MTRNLFRPRRLLDPWRDDFVIALRLRSVSGRRIGDALAQVDTHCTDSGEAPEEAFGDPVAYATHVTEQIRPVDFASSVSPLRAGLSGLAVLLAVTALLSGVAGLHDGVPAELSVGSLAGAGAGTAAIALMVRFASVLWDPRRFGRRFGAMFLLLAAMMWPSIVWTSTAVELSAWLSVGIAVVLLAATWVSLRATRPDVVVDPLTGDSLPTPGWLAPGVHWLLPVTLAGAILLILFVPGLACC
jgi:hypothetical protein